MINIYNLDRISVTDQIKPYLGIILEDDDTPFGGTVFEGETVEDFIRSFGTDDIKYMKVNFAIRNMGL